MRCKHRVQIRGCGSGRTHFLGRDLDVIYVFFFTWPHALLRLFGLELLMDLAKFLSSLGSGIFFVCVEESRLLE